MAVAHLMLFVLIAVVGAACAQYGVVEVPNGLSPRFYPSFPQQIFERQSGLCAANSHSCLDVNASVCCPNTRYCIIDSTLQPACCDIGSNCGNTCGSSSYQCASTTTIAGQAKVTTTCCPRSCPSTSAFKCAATYGGGCCSYGYMCESGNQCKSIVQSTTSVSVPEVSNGCATSQIACSSSVGGGCCNADLTCAVINDANFCVTASGTAMKTGTDGNIPSGVSTSAGKPGFSTGVKAGIGASIVVVACMLLGTLTFFCIKHRKASLGDKESSSVPALSQISAPGHRLAASPQKLKCYGPPGAVSLPSEGSTTFADSHGFNRGVRTIPHTPDDVAAPVEIDSSSHSNVISPGAFEYLKYPSMTENAAELS